MEELFVKEEVNKLIEAAYRRGIERGQLHEDGTPFFCFVEGSIACEEYHEEVKELIKDLIETPHDTV